MPLTGVSLPSQGSPDLLGRQEVWLVMVDDEAEIVGQVMRALGHNTVLRFHHFLRVEDFAAAPLQFCDLCIVDAYFDGTSRIRKLIGMIKERWENCQVILLSNFADFITPHDRASIYECLAKPQFLLEPSALRKILIGALRRCRGLARTQ